MYYTIKEIVKIVDISEQGLYKKIKTNYDELLKKEYIVVQPLNQGLVGTQPNHSTKTQIFITQSGLDDLLKTKQLREGVRLEDFIKNDKRTKNEPRKSLVFTQPKFSRYTKPLNQNTQPKQPQSASNELLKLLNQNINDLKEENKRLNEKIEKQEEKFDAKIEQQKKEFQEQYNKQQEAYQQTLNKILQSFNNALLQLPQPQEIKKTEAEEPRGIKKLFKNIFKR